MSHNTYGQRNKVPQEAVPEEVSQKVIMNVFQSACFFGLPVSSPMSSCACHHLAAITHGCRHVQVAGEALASFAKALGLPGPEALPGVAYQRCQLWGAGELSWRVSEF